MKHKHIELVLSGGGARWVAHIGVIKRLIEHGYHISAVSGASAGSLIWLFVCSGMPIDDIIDLVTHVKLRDMLKIDISLTSYMNLNNLEKIIKQYIAYDDLADLPCPLYVSTTDLKTGHNIIYSQGNISTLIKASCSIPFSFKAVSYDRKILVDWGITNNFPIEPFVSGYDELVRNQTNTIPLHHDRRRPLLIGIDVNPYESLQKNSIAEVIPRSLKLLVQQSYQFKKHLCDYCIQPQALKKIGIFHAHHYQQIIEIGYQAAEDQWWSQQERSEL